MIPWLFVFLLLHPGHTTRIEIDRSEDGKCFEIAARFDSLDIENALKNRLQSPVDVESLSDNDAKVRLGNYLRDTISLGNRKLTTDQFRWVGWQRSGRQVWIYFEVVLATSDRNERELQIKTLFEVEPQCQHVVVVGKSGSEKTIVVTKSRHSIRLPDVMKSQDD